VIATNPRIARERDEIYPPVRIHPFKAHLVVYRIEDNETIFVIRLQGNEDWVNNTI
jgi:toxin ParE1/3/4